MKFQATFKFKYICSIVDLQMICTPNPDSANMSCPKIGLH